MQGFGVLKTFSPSQHTHHTTVLPPPPRALRSKQACWPPQVHWWRLVVDEAQMVGPLSASGNMVEKMRAVHR